MTMTDKRLAKRLARLSEAFYDMCTGRSCEGCEMKAFVNEGVCEHAWVLQKMTEVKERKSKCYYCKNSRYFAKYAMRVCLKHRKFDPKEACEDYEKKGGKK